MDYDAVLNNKSLQLIDGDFDDGLVVNYAKFEVLFRRYNSDYFLSKLKTLFIFSC